MHPAIFVRSVPFVGFVFGRRVLPTLQRSNCAVAFAQNAFVNRPVFRGDLLVDVSPPGSPGGSCAGRGLGGGHQIFGDGQNESHLQHVPVPEHGFPGCLAAVGQAVNAIDFPVDGAGGQRQRCSEVGFRPVLAGCVQPLPCCGCGRTTRSTRWPAKRRRPAPWR